MEAGTMSVETLTKEPIAAGAVFMEKAKAADEMYVRGFVSTNSRDRDLDVVDPRLFDIDGFMKNPQLWINHGLWATKEGNRISVGTVEEMAPVRVVNLDKAAGTFDLEDLRKDGGVVRSGLSDEEFLVKEGQKGVWVVAKVVVPDVIDLIESKRLNAFSWSGVMLRRKSGEVAKIDVFEVSVVNVPANQKALFQIGKSLHVQTKDGNTINVDGEALQALGTVQHQDGASLTTLEKYLVSRNSDDADAHNSPPKGGDHEMELGDLQKKLDAMTSSIENIAEKYKNVDGLTETIKKLDERLQTVESEITKAGKSGDAEPTKEQEAAMSELEKKFDSIATALDAVAKQSETVDQLADSVKKIDDRLANVEKAPAARKSADDDDQPDPASVKEAVEKALTQFKEGGNPAKLARTALGMKVVPDHVANGHKG